MSLPKPQYDTFRGRRFGREYAGEINAETAEYAEILEFAIRFSACSAVSALILKG
jgi:hypothetical protein